MVITYLENIYIYKFSLIESWLNKLVLEDLVGLHRTVQLQLFQHYWLGHNLDYCDIEWFALETNRDYSLIFEIASKYYILDSFADYDGYSISSKGSCLQ